MSSIAARGDGQSPPLGYTFMIFSAVCHALMSFTIHVAETQFLLPTTTCLLIRSFTSLLFSSTYITVHGLWHAFRLSKVQLLQLCLRGCLGASAAYLTYGALARLPVGVSTTILYLSPVVTSVFAALFLSERLTLVQMLIILLNFVGVALVSHPALPSGATSVRVGVLMAACAALCASSVFTLVRAMGLRVHFMLGVFTYGIACLVLTLTIGSVESMLTDLRENHWGVGWALASGVAGFGSQTFLNRGLQHAPSGPAIIVRSLNVPITFALGLAALDERVDWVSGGGVFLVLLSVGMIGWRQWSKQLLDFAELQQRQKNKLVDADSNDSLHRYGSLQSVVEDDGRCSPPRN